MKKDVEAAVAKVAAAAAARDAALLLVGNLVHDSVPVDDDEVRLRSHHESSPCCLHVALFRWIRS